MGKQSLLGRIAKALREEKEQSSEDIDREVESAVKAIDELEVDVVEGGGLVGGGWGEAGEMVYIMDLAPIYAIIGGRKGRQADNLHETCGRVFSQRVEARRGRGAVEATGFFMRFTNAGKEEGFHLAATIVNDIGERVLGGRFQAMEVPALVVVADAASITNEDGSLNMEKTKSVVKSGGLAVTMEAPDADAPLWLRQRWDTPLGSGEGDMVRDGADTETTPGDPEWDPTETRPEPGAPDWGPTETRPELGDPEWGATETRPDHISTKEWEETKIRRKATQAAAEKPKRSQEEYLSRDYQDRRKTFRPFKGPDNRVAMDRRGRGF